MSERKNFAKAMEMRRNVGSCWRFLRQSEEALIVGVPMYNFSHISHLSYSKFYMFINRRKPK